MLGEFRGFYGVYIGSCRVFREKEDLERDLFRNICLLIFVFYVLGDEG